MGLYVIHPGSQKGALQKCKEQQLQQLWQQRNKKVNSSSQHPGESATGSLWNGTLRHAYGWKVKVSPHSFGSSAGL